MTPSNATSTAAAIDDFNDAFGLHDLDRVVAAMTPDCVFESTSPPDGRCYEGREQVRAAFAEFFAASPDARFETEDAIVTGDRAVVRWTYRWGDGDDARHVRGIDLFVVRDGKVAEKHSYVKG